MPVFIPAALAFLCCLLFLASNFPHLWQTFTSKPRPRCSLHHCGHPPQFFSGGGSHEHETSKNDCLSGFPCLRFFSPRRKKKPARRPLRALAPVQKKAMAAPSCFRPKPCAAPSALDKTPRAQSPPVVLRTGRIRGRYLRVRIRCSGQPVLTARAHSEAPRRRPFAQRWKHGKRAG